MSAPRIAGAQGNQSEGWKQLLDAGINDWGGLSPLTRDFVNPEKPWPHLKALADATAATGKCLVPRLENSSFSFLPAQTYHFKISLLVFSNFRAYYKLVCYHLDLMM